MMYLSIILLALASAATAKDIQTTVEEKNLEIMKLFLDQKTDYTQDVPETLSSRTPSIDTQPEKEFVIIVASYQNAQYYIKNMSSLFSQNYAKYRIIYIDDCSPDGTADLVEQYAKQCGQEHRVTLIRNTSRQRAMANIYEAVHQCKDDEVIVLVNGDDWLAHDHVLAKLNTVYNESDVWLTYGSYSPYPEGIHNHCKQIPSSIIDNNSYRQAPWVSSHLKTFYAWLFKNIDRQDFLCAQHFAPMTHDLAIMFPLLELSGGRSAYIDEILYIYNTGNPLNDHKVNVGLQRHLEQIFRSKKKYTPLACAPASVSKNKAPHSKKITPNTATLTPEPKKVSIADTFTKIYEANSWESPESVSGPGSCLESTKTIRHVLPVLLQALNVTSMLDAPCGDFNWFKTLDFNGLYIGTDIVPALVDTNQKKYGNAQRTFICRNIITDALPTVDLILCRDTLQHLPHNDVLAVLKNFKATKATYLLATTNLGTTNNANIEVGQVYPYNLELPPFNLPKPVYIIEEASAEHNARRFRKTLGLWRLEDLAL